MMETRSRPMKGKRQIPRWATYLKGTPRSWDSLPRDVMCVTCGRYVRLFSAVKACPYCGERG